MKNNLFKIGQAAMCVSGSNKGKTFIIEKILGNGYSCTLKNGPDDKFYHYNDSTLTPVGIH